jgi:hypothetical protein
MPTRDELRTRLFLNAALPLVKVVREENKTLRHLTAKLNGVVQFEVKGTDWGAHLIFGRGELEFKRGKHEKPNVAFVFKNLVQLNNFFAGKSMMMAWVRGLYRLDLIGATLPMLLSLKMLMPDADPKEPAKRALKVKLLLYMVTSALSQLNKAGDELMTKLTKGSPDRVYQWTVPNGPSAFLRMKNGKTKAGRGVYTRRRPFVLMRFSDFEGAYQVLTSKAPLVEAVKRGYVVTEGAMEYSKEIGLRMQYIEELMA